MKVRLRDDRPDTTTFRTVALAVPATMADAVPSTADEVQVLPTLTVSVRRRGEPTEDGDPTWSWSELFSAVAFLWTQSERVDDLAGVIVVSAKAIVLYDGGAVVDETCSVASDHGGVWRPTRVAQLPDRVEFTLTRTYQAESEE